jgi:ubiquinone/menaquinone biosynthesis C-methylase UbiE
VQKDDRPHHQQQGKFSPFDIWEKGGLTEHIGGIYATRRLLARCHLAVGQQILDVGCGTGYTACHLAKAHQVRVIALDINPRSVTEASRRVAKQGAEPQVSLAQANAHWLPFSDALFDAVIAESVIVFCNATAVISEIRRILKPNGMLRMNEVTFLKAPPAGLASLLSSTFGIHAFQQDEWESILRKAGFANVSSSIHRFNLWEQLASHLKADGLKNYLAGTVTGVRDASIRGTFFTREMLAAARDFLPYVGYGLYTGQKPD